MPARLCPARVPLTTRRDAGFLQPWLEAGGFPRESYEVVCALREPVDWLNSWWRYRSRDDLADPAHHVHGNYAGHLSFEGFARAYIEWEREGGERSVRLAPPPDLVRPLPGQPAMDRVFRYDRLDLLADFLRRKVGEEVGVRNVSLGRSFGLSEGCERELREFLAPEYEIYERTIGGVGSGPPG